MSSLPLVNVTARVNDQQGRPVAGAVVKMRLTTVEKYQGIIVPRETMQVTDAAGVAILRVFPNALGYEGSEYDVHITFPGANSGVCGSVAPSTPALRAIRAHAVVPNVDCNLLDILNLPPYEQRGAGSVLPQEVAGYAAEAANHADAARSSAQAAEASKGAIIALTDATEAAKSAAQASAKEAATHAQQTKNSADRVDEIVCDFENTVIEKTEKTAQRLMAKATSCIKEQEVVSLNAIEQRSADVLLDFTTAATEARAGAVAAILESKENALHAVDDAKLSALDDLQEVGAEYEEDFVALVERAEGAAKRAGCSSAGAANSAAKACACAEEAKTAAQGLERSKDDALAAASRAETAASCASADAQRAETAADGVKANAESAKQSAVAAQKNAQAADASADSAKSNADSAKESAADADADRAAVEAIADDVKKAVLDTAATIVSEEIIDKATAQATAEANAARDAALAAQTETAKAQVASEAAQAGAESARNGIETALVEAKGHADRAADVVRNLDVSIDGAVPKPEWDGTSLVFKNANGSIETDPVELKGDKGDAATIAVGTVTGIAAGETPTVTNAGTAHAAELHFAIPQGDKGDQGDAATITVGTVTSLAAGSTPTITNTGTPHAAVLDFAIPQGEKGDTPNVSIIAGTGLSGGGDLTADLTLSVAYGDSEDTACAGDDARLSDARTPTPHTASHMHGGNDEIATTAPAANAIPKAGADGKISKGWIPDFVGGATVVSTPVIALGDVVPIGIPTECTVTASPLLSGSRTIASFIVSIPELALHEVVAATADSASVVFTVPAGTAVGTEFTVVIYAVDDMGNASADVTKKVQAKAAFVNVPIIMSPTSGAKVSTSNVQFLTGAFAVVGASDTHIASQYRIRRVSDEAIMYDSGEIASLLSHTALKIEGVDKDIDYVAEVRHKGASLGWSAWSGNTMQFFVYSGRLGVWSNGMFAVTDDFKSLPSSETGIKYFYAAGKNKFKGWYYVRKDYTTYTTMFRTQDFVTFEEINLPCTTKTRGPDSSMEPMVFNEDVMYVVGTIDTSPQPLKVYKSIDGINFTEHATVITSSETYWRVHAGISKSGELFIFVSISGNEGFYAVTTTGAVRRITTGFTAGSAVNHFVLNGDIADGYVYVYRRLMTGSKYEIYKLKDGAASAELAHTIGSDAPSLYANGRIWVLDGTQCKYVSGNSLVSVSGVSTAQSYVSHWDETGPLQIFNSTEGFCEIDSNLAVTVKATPNQVYGYIDNSSSVFRIQGEVRNTARKVAFRDGKWTSLEPAWTALRLIDNANVVILDIARQFISYTTVAFNGKVYAIDYTLKRVIRIEPDGTVVPLYTTLGAAPLSVIGNTLSGGRWWMNTDEQFFSSTSSDGISFTNEFVALKTVAGKLFGIYGTDFFVSGDGKSFSRVLTSVGEYLVEANVLPATYFDGKYAFVKNADKKLYQSLTGASGWNAPAPALVSTSNKAALDTVDSKMFYTQANVFSVSSSLTAPFVQIGSTMNTSSSAVFLLDGKYYINDGNKTYEANATTGPVQIPLNYIGKIFKLSRDEEDV